MHLRQIIGAELARQIETGTKQPHQLAGDIRVRHQGAGYVRQLKAQANLFEITRVGAQKGHITPGEPCQQHQPVEGVVLCLPGPDRGKGIAEQRVGLLNIQRGASAKGELKIMNPELRAVCLHHAERKLAQHTQAKVFQHRDHIRQRQ